MKTYVGVLILFNIVTNVLLCQSNSWELTFQTGDTLSNVTLVSISNDSLTVLHQGISRLIAVSSINEIRLVKESVVWKTIERYGLVTGVVGGVASGTAIAVSAKGGSFYSIELSNTTAKILGVVLGVPFYGVIFAVLGGFVGSIVGVMESTDEVYDLSAMTMKGKVYTIRLILSDQ